MAKKKQSSSPARKRGKGKKPTARTNTPGRLTLSALRNRRRRDPESLRLRALEPSLTVDDIERSVHFYTSVLGFIVAERWTEGGKLLGVNLKAGACELGLSQDDWAKGRDRTKGVGVRIWCRTAQDIDSLASRIKASGGRLASEPADQSWGVRSLAVDDPDGYHLAIYQERGDAS